MAEKGGRPYIAMMLIGLALAIGVFIALLIYAFTWATLIFYGPLLAVAAFLIFFARAKLRKK